MIPFVIPSIFTAVDGLSTPVRNMGTSMDGLTVSVARSERAFTSLSAATTGIFGSNLPHALGLLMKFAAATAVLTSIGYTAKAVADYSTEISNLSAVTGAVGPQLELFKDKIRGVADETKKSMVFVAQAFTAVDNNMPELHKDANALAEVTKQAIILAKASRIELQPAAEYLTMSMNQFGMTSREAASAVDVMAAGAVYGSSRIGETAEALQKFGATAKNVAHMTFAESVALVELGSKFEKGAEAGTRFNRILVDIVAVKPNSELSRHLQQYGVDVHKVSNLALPFFDRMKEMSKIKSSPVLMEEVFGKRGITMAAGLFSRIDEYQGILSKYTQQGLASQMATTNVNNITGVLEQLRDRFVNVFITSTNTNTIMNMLKDSIVFVTNHLDGLVTIGAMVLEFFIGWKVSILAVRGALWAYNFVAGIAAARTGVLLSSSLATTAGIYGLNAAVFVLNSTLLELSLLTVGVAAALAVIVFAFSDGYDAGQNYVNQLDSVKNGFVQLAKPISQAELALRDYNNAMKDFNELKNFEAYIAYEETKGYWHGWMARAYGTFRHPSLSASMMAEQISGDSTRSLPNMSDFPGLDSTKATNPFLDSANKASGNGLHASVDNQRIEIHINNKSGHPLDIDDQGAPAIKVTSTTNSWGGGEDKWT